MIMRGKYAMPEKEKWRKSPDFMNVFFCFVSNIPNRCQEVYGEHVNIHDGHLCGGTMNGKGGTCVGKKPNSMASRFPVPNSNGLFTPIGDSGGPLNCRLHKNGPWILAGITSFGSGCSEQSYHPDVYIRISHYIKWIMKTMAQNWSIDRTNQPTYLLCSSIIVLGF